MATKSTVYKIQLSVADISRGYYEDHALTLAQHPSETDARMILRIVVFALNAHERLELAKGLSDVDEPDLWQKSLTGEIEHWIELGQPTEKRIRQSCSKADRVTLYTYQRGTTNLWFEGLRAEVDRFKHLGIFHLSLPDEAVVTAMLGRTMKLNCVIEDGQVLLSDETHSLNIELKELKSIER